MDTQIKDCLKIAKKVEKQYDRFGGVNLEKTPYLFTSEKILPCGGTVIQGECLSKLKSKKILEGNGYEESLEDKKIYYSNGSSININHPDFLKFPTVIICPSVDYQEFTLNHELNHIGIIKLLSKKEENLKNKEETMIYCSLLEGSALINGARYSMTKKLSSDLETWYLVEKDKISSAKEIIESSISSNPNETFEKFMEETDNKESLYYIGINFIRTIPHNNLRHLAQIINKNFPTMEELLNPELYSKNLK